MKRHLVPKTRQFKANLHCHSTISDGTLSPEKLKEAYKAAGYSVLAYSDHNKLVPHAGLRDEDFLPVTSVEIDITKPTGKWLTAPTYHLNFFSKDENKSEFVPVRRVYDIDVINDLIRRAKAEGFLAQYNHPRWSFQQPDDYLPLEGISTFEVYNTGCEMVMLNGYGDAEYDIALRAGHRVFPTASDDNHNLAGEFHHSNSDSFGAFTMLCMERLDYAAAMAAIENGDLYASSGPEIYEFSAEDGNLFVKCSPASTVSVLTESRAVRANNSKSGDMTIFQTDTDFRYDWKYLRLMVKDRRGNRAFTRAYARDEVLGPE